MKESNGDLCLVSEIEKKGELQRRTSIYQWDNRIYLRTVASCQGEGVV